MNIIPNFKKLGALLVAAALVTAGCSSAASTAGAVSLVASTSVWADVTRQVVGGLGSSRVSIKAIITSPTADPHSYEVSTRDELAIKNADVIVENGGGYDDFMATMRSAAGAKGTVLDAVKISGVRAVDGDLNEHVWYDFPAVARIAQRIADALAEKDATDAATFRANARAFAVKLRGLEQREAAVKARFAGEGVAITEPVPLYMLTACGLVNRTPRAFSSAVEDGQDVAVRVLQQTKDLFTSHQVKALVYNAQTTGPQTSSVVNAAKAAGVPVVPVTETLPKGRTYLGWMTANLAAVQSALARGA